MIDYNTIATGSNDKTVKLWNLQTFELMKEISFKSDVTALSAIVKFDGSFTLCAGLYKKIALLNSELEVMKYLDSGIHSG